MPKLCRICGSACICAFSFIAAASAENSFNYNRTYDLSTAPQLKIVTYAIDNLKADETGTLASGLALLDADVIALNESSKEMTSESFSQAVKELSRLIDYSYVLSDKTNDGNCSVGLISRYPIENVVSINYQDINQHLPPILCAEIKLPQFDSPVLFLNTAFENNEDLESKIAAVRSINDFVKNQNDNNDAITDKELKIKVLTGNFNDTANGPVLYELSRYFNLVDSQSNEDFRTYPALNPALDLSHILTYRGQVWETSAVTVIKGNQGHMPWQEFASHLPIFATLKLIEQ